MKGLPALLILSLSALAWAGAAGPRTGKSRKDDSTPLTQDKFDTSPEKFTCLEHCQKPILDCMSHCNNKAACADQCHGEQLAQCPESCGMVKKK
ncbi:MAG: hypothetical protein ACJ8AT_27040 [Hyalangium sp.]|uniref:hypothetical protein n=1 Tax=Hyalangium sp. TaxID=2028555 RepID=UPI003899B88B